VIDPSALGRLGQHTAKEQTSGIALARICIEPAIWSSGSLTKSNTVAGSQRTTTSLRRTTSRSFSLRQSGCGCALMSPRPKLIWSQTVRLYQYCKAIEPKLAL
jgi:hypothetical protein